MTLIIRGKKSYYVREAVQGDERDVQDMHEELFPDDEVLPFSYGQWWIMMDADDEPMGFCQAGPSELVEGAWFLGRAGILPEHQGQGLQKSLIQIRLDYLKAIGVTEAVTYTSNDNYPSANSLISMGFKLTEFPEKFKDNDGFLYWRKHIDG